MMNITAIEPLTPQTIFMKIGEVTHNLWTIYVNEKLLSGVELCLGKVGEAERIKVKQSNADPCLAMTGDVTAHS